MEQTRLWLLPSSIPFKTGMSLMTPWKMIKMSFIESDKNHKAKSKVFIFLTEDSLNFT